MQIDSNVAIKRKRNKARKLWFLLVERSWGNRTLEGAKAAPPPLLHGGTNCQIKKTGHAIWQFVPAGRYRPAAVAVGLFYYNLAVAHLHTVQTVIRHTSFVHNLINQ
jgi:hypothetical protein